MTSRKDARTKIKKMAGRQCDQMLTLSLWIMNRLLKMRAGVLKLIRYPSVMLVLSFINSGAFSKSPMK